MNKKILSINMILVLLALCGCTPGSSGNQENTDTRFMLDTYVTLTAKCSDDTLDRAFVLCSDFENKLSRTKENSEVYKLNHTKGFTKISDDTLNIIQKGVYYGRLTGGRFDITVCPVMDLWDFNNEVVPSRNEIAEALKNVDYHSIKIDGNKVDLNGKMIDLGGIAKGYIADKLRDFLVEEKVPEGIVNLGGNVVVFGDRDYNIGIKDPLNADGIIASVNVKNKCVVTSGTYERSFEKDGKFYHHIIDPLTGYGVESGLTSVTIIADSAVDADAFATCCILLGEMKSYKMIESMDGMEAVFVNKEGNVSVSSGLSLNGKEIAFR